MMTSKNTSVLVVEDDESIRTSLSTVLSEYGYRVRSAEDGFSALLEIRTEVPDVILSDLHMPGMSGFELLAVVRIYYPGVKVIAMSGAYAGDLMPPGVTSDFFHAKGSSVGCLLQTLKALVASHPTYRHLCRTATIFSPEGQA
jgi:DNA-binding NarL/FixJ family response regulator